MFLSSLSLVATSEDQVGDEEAEVIPQPDLVRMMMMMMSMVRIISLICCTSAPTRQVAKECRKDKT